MRQDALFNASHHSKGDPRASCWYLPMSWRSARGNRHAKSDMRNRHHPLKRTFSHASDVMKEWRAGRNKNANTYVIEIRR